MAFESFRRRVFDYLVRKKLNTHNADHHSVKLERAQTIGILFEAKEPSNFVQINNFVKPFKEAGKKIELLGYLDLKNPAGQIAHPYFTKKDISLFYIPKNPEVDYFTKKKIDILLNCYPPGCAPLEYITTFSQAAMRVGPYNERMAESFDLMIEFSDEFPDLKTMLTNYLTFLKMIKTNDN